MTVHETVRIVIHGHHTGGRFYDARLHRITEAATRIDYLNRVGNPMGLMYSIWRSSMQLRVKHGQQTEEMCLDEFRQLVGGEYGLTSLLHVVSLLERTGSITIHIGGIESTVEVVHVAGDTLVRR